MESATADLNPASNLAGASSDLELENLIPAQVSDARPSDVTTSSQPPKDTNAHVHEPSTLDDTKATDRTSRLSRHSGWGFLWIYEISAAILSLVFMAAILIVLKQIDGKPMSSWNLPLSPNTLIAIFSTSSKSAILFVISACLGQLKWVYFERKGQRLIDLQMFDDASRGPLGSLWLLSRVRWTFVAASCGALLTILALAQDAFYQEVYSTYTADTAQIEETATIARASSFDSIYGLPDNLFAAANRDLSAAMFGGFSTPREPDFICPSGNCTWPSFDSLGVCSSCQDMSTDLEKSCQTEEDMTFCDYTVGPGLNTSASFQYGSFERGGTILNITSESSRDSRASLDHIARVGILRIDQDQFDNVLDETNVENIELAAYECTLSWCRHTYAETIVGNGLLDESTASESPFLRGNDTGHYKADMKDCESQQNQWDEPRLFAVYQTEPDPEMIAANSTALMDELLSDCPDIEAISFDTSSYIVNQDDGFHIKRTLDHIFRGEADSRVGNYANIMAYIIYAANDGDIPQTMDNVARSLTNAVRSGPQTQSHHGTVYRTEVYMRVDWEWLIYPAVLLGLALLFLAATLFLSAQRSRTVWKLSSIATLFHGLQGWPKEALAHERVEEMERDAKNMRVKLARDEDGHLALVRE